MITEWRRLLLPVADASVVVAVSGGADSVSLLLALVELREKKKLDLKIVAAHFDHGLRGKESDKDAEFVRKLASKINVEFVTEKWKRGKDKKKENLEQAARLARYKFLERTAELHGASVILTGHTINDQAETFLLRLVRGSGLDGLGAMKTIRRLHPEKNVILVRPMLGWALREDTEAFCRENKVKFRQDRMNRDEAFLRVKVRKKLIPLLKEFNPQVVPGLAKMAGLLQQESEELDALAAEALGSVTGANKATIDVKALRDLLPARRKRVLRLWLQGLRGDLRRLDMEHFAALERLVLNDTGGKTVELPGGERVVVKKGRLEFGKIQMGKG